MTNFKRYRNELGGEFTSGVSDELAAQKGWTDITDDEHPAVDANGRPLEHTPADRASFAAGGKVTTKSTPTTAGNTPAYSTPKEG